MKLDKASSCDKEYKLIPPNVSAQAFDQVNVLNATELLCFLMQSNEISSETKKDSHGQDCALGGLKVQWTSLKNDGSADVIESLVLHAVELSKKNRALLEKAATVEGLKLLWTSLKNDSSADAIYYLAKQAVDLKKENDALLEKVSTLESTVATLESTVDKLESRVANLSQEKADLEEDIERLDYEYDYCSLNLTVAMKWKELGLNLVEKEIPIEEFTDEMYKTKNVTGQK